MVESSKKQVKRCARGPPRTTGRVSPQPSMTQVSTSVLGSSASNAVDILTKELGLAALPRALRPELWLSKAVGPTCGHEVVS